MALEKQVIIGKIEILPDGQMQIREDTVVLENGIELMRTYHRRVLAPGDPVPEKTDDRIRAVIEAVWTPSVVVEFQAVQQAASDARVASTLTETFTPEMVK